MILALEGKIDKVLLLLSFGANVNSYVKFHMKCSLTNTVYYMTPLHCALFKSQWDMADVLLDMGADCALKGLYKSEFKRSNEVRGNASEFVKMRCSLQNVSLRICKELQGI